MQRRGAAKRTAPSTLPTTMLCPCWNPSSPSTAGSALAMQTEKTFLTVMFRLVTLCPSYPLSPILSCLVVPSEWTFFTAFLSFYPDSTACVFGFFSISLLVGCAAFFINCIFRIGSVMLWWILLSWSYFLSCKYVMCELACLKKKKKNSFST